MQAAIRVLVAVVLIGGFNLFYFDVASADITIDGETIHFDQLGRYGVPGRVAIGLDWGCCSIGIGGKQRIFRPVGLN